MKLPVRHLAIAAATVLLPQAVVGMIETDGGVGGILLWVLLLVSSGLAIGLLLTDRRVGFDIAATPASSPPSSH